MFVKNILIGGEAGQGLVTIGEILSRCLVESGYYIVAKQVYQSRIRGGHNFFAIRVSDEKIDSAEERAIDLLIALNEETYSLYKDEITKEGFAIKPYENFSGGKFLNTAAVGIASEVLGLDEALVENVLAEHFGRKDEAVAKENNEILEKAWRWAAEQKNNFKKLPTVSPPLRGGGKGEGELGHRVMLNGNEAISAGAISAGVKFCAFYPMTPSTTISLNLIKHSKEHGIIIEQAEDEIAALNMAIGASFAGAPSMVATSGGGFALMVEAVSLAGMTETPVVIVVGQRPGPATGLPTRTEQAELEFILHAGHGEFPRAIFAPGSIEECFELTNKAFHLAESSQGPVFILTDQFLADSFRVATPFKPEKYSKVKVGADPKSVQGIYKRYQFTETGVSPRLIPGASKHLVVADSDEHTEDGHITEDLNIRKKMVEKRLLKLNILKENLTPPSYFGADKPDILFVSWGSSKGACIEAAKTIGEKAGALHFGQVWPLKPELFLKKLESAKKVISVESNATKQFARLIRRETGFEIKENICRYDGLPITAEYINLCLP